MKSKVKKKIFEKNENGSATVVVFVTVLFTLMILGTIFTTMVLKNKSQQAEFKMIKDSYNEDMGTLYNERTDGKYTFDYTGKEQVWSVPVTGYYLIEAWGASGGSSTNSGVTNVGGYGGYSQGVVKLTSKQTLYVNVGGEGVYGTTSTAGNGGYNGGGNGTKGTYSNVIRAGGGGGGATHVALASGLLSTLSGGVSNILIVAGGGRRRYGV